MINRLLDGIRSFFDSWRFPTFALTLLLAFNALLLVIILLPPAPDALSQFAADFRKWCFAADDAGNANIHYILTFFIGPVLLTGIIFAIWRSDLRVGLREHRISMLPWASAGLALGVGLALLLPSFGSAVAGAANATNGQGDLGFPAAELRQATAPPEIQLIDHTNQPVALSDYVGRPVIVTGAYSCCTAKCPLIIMQIVRVLESLPADLQDEVVVLVISLDPERDSPERLAGWAEAYGVTVPQWHFCTGEPDEVNRVLDQLRIRRERDPETGVIDHANLYFCIDRAGRIAFKFSLGELQEEWMKEALPLLIREPAPRQP